MPTYTIHGCRAGRDEAFESHVARVWNALSSLTALSPRFGPWWRRGADDDIEPVESAVEPKVGT